MENQNTKQMRGGVSSFDLFAAWEYFKRGKAKKFDVILFGKDIKSTIRALDRELKNKTYQHSPYVTFYVKDPKLREINKATVRDRVLHQALFSKLYLLFDKFFIFDSYSSRDEKGTHAAVKRLHEFAAKASINNTRTCYVLKCDIKKFFTSIDQEVLMALIKRRIRDENMLWLLDRIIKSFKKGIPLGNVTSQIFANIYLNELDQFLKRKLKIKYYIRYCDDFLVLSENKIHLEGLIPKISDFLREKLKLVLHPDKISIRKYHQGVDILGYVNFSRHKTLRIKTAKRMFKKLENKMSELKREEITEESFSQTLWSYYGMLKHSDSYRLGERVIDFLIGQFL